jgi:hypothetical protein
MYKIEFNKLKGVITKTFLAIILMFNSQNAFALTVIDNSIPSETTDWGSSINANSLSNVSAATCAGLDAAALVQCQSATDFDLVIPPTTIPDANNLVNENTEDQQSNTNNNVTQINNDNSNNQSQSEEIVEVFEISNLNESTNNTQNNITDNYVKDDGLDENNKNSLGSEDSSIIEANLENNPDNSVNNNSVQIEVNKPVEQVTKKPLTYKRQPNNSVQTTKKSITNTQIPVDKIFSDVENLASLAQIASADLLDWTENTGRNYQADPFLMYIWLGLAGFQSVFILAYLLNRHLQSEIIKYKK